MSEWRECKLGESVISNRQSIGRDYPHQNIIYLDTGSITRGKIETLQDIKLSGAPSRAKRLVKHNDIVYSTVRPIQRHYGIINNPPENLVVSTGFSVIEANLEKANPLFIYYFLTSDEIVETLDVIAEASTSAYPSLRPSDIENLDIFLPPLPEQRAIAGVLSSLDDKIDLLHRQNKTLEAMAETLFRQWFVEEAEEGWEEVKLEEYVDCITGYSYKSIDLNPSNIALVTLKNFARDGSFRMDGFKEYTGNFKESQVVKQGELVVSHTDITQEADIIGNPALVIDPWQYETLIITMDLMKVESTKEWLSKEFLFYLFKSSDFKFHCLGCSNGTTVLHMSRKAIPSYEFKMPNKEKIIAFTENIKPIIEKKFKNISQICTLEKLRDTLLPKLMSGEVGVEYGDK